MNLFQVKSAAQTTKKFHKNISTDAGSVLKPLRDGSNGVIKLTENIEKSLVDFQDKIRKKANLDEYREFTKTNFNATHKNFLTVVDLEIKNQFEGLIMSTLRFQKLNLALIEIIRYMKRYVMDNPRLNADEIKDRQRSLHTQLEITLLWYTKEMHPGLNLEIISTAVRNI